MFSVIFLMAGDIKIQRNQVVLGKFSHEKGSVGRPKSLFLSYFEKDPLIQLTWLGPLRTWPKFEHFSGVVVEMTSWWWMADSKRVRPWSNKARCYSEEASIEGCLRASMIVIDEDIEHFLSRRSWIEFVARTGYSLYMDTI